MLTHTHSRTRTLTHSYVLLRTHAIACSYVRTYVHTHTQEAGKKELAREQYRSSKAMEQLVASYKAKAKESEDRRVAGLVARVDMMCSSMEAEKEQFQRNLKEFERTTLMMKERAMLHEKQGKDWAIQMAALRRELDEARAQADGAAREADKERRAAVVLREEVEALERRLAEQETATKNVSNKWNQDVDLMQKQLQQEVAARIAAEERLLEAEDHSRRNVCEPQEAGEEDVANATCAKCREKDRFAEELQSAVTLLNEQLSSVYRDKAAGDKEKERQHAKALAAVKDEMAGQLTAARDGQAFAEKVAHRLECELLKQTQAILQQQNRQQASGLKRRMAAGKHHSDFKDFSADVERLTGGGKSKAVNGGAQTPREPVEHEHAHAHPHGCMSHTPHTQLPAMQPLQAPQFPSGMQPPASGRLGGGVGSTAGCCGGNGAAGGAGTKAGAEARLSDIRRPTPPIGGSAGSGRHRAHAHACPSLNLAGFEGSGRASSEGGAIAAAAVTERGGMAGGARRLDASRGARHLLPQARAGSFSAR